MSDYRTVKDILNRIIDEAYANDPLNSKFKHFKIFILPDEKKTKSGDYRTGVIRVYNPSQAHMHKTLLHELAHHIDFCRNGHTGHQEAFYAEYRKLIYASLDLKLLNKKDFMQDTKSTDSRKVKEIIKDYRPSPKHDSIEFSRTIKVYNAYCIKDEIRERGYKWDKIEKAWEIQTEDTETETEWLESKDVKPDADKETVYYTIEKTSLRFKAKIPIAATGESTYAHRDELKAEGFRWTARDGMWEKDADQDTAEQEISRLKKKFNGSDIKIIKKGNMPRRAAKRRRLTDDKTVRR